MRARDGWVTRSWEQMAGLLVVVTLGGRLGRGRQVLWGWAGVAGNKLPHFNLEPVPQGGI